jgi:hypothetical protein
MLGRVSKSLSVAEKALGGGSPMKDAMELANRFNGVASIADKFSQLTGLASIADKFNHVNRLNGALASASEKMGNSHQFGLAGLAGIAEREELDFGKPELSVISRYFPIIKLHRLSLRPPVRRPELALPVGITVTRRIATRQSGDLTRRSVSNKQRHTMMPLTVQSLFYAHRLGAKLFSTFPSTPYASFAFLWLSRRVRFRQDPFSLLLHIPISSQSTKKGRSAGTQLERPSHGNFGTRWVSPTFRYYSLDTIHSVFLATHRNIIFDNTILT